MTEHFIDDQTIAGVIQTAKQILDCLAVGHYQVWTHWEMIRPYGLIDDTTGARTKRGCVVAQSARWIRPGYVRASVTYNPNSGVYVTAFKSGTKLVVVAVNNGTASVSQSFSIINGTSPTSFTPYRTSSTQDLATLSTVAVSGGTFAATLPAQSITTFVSP